MEDQVRSEAKALQNFTIPKIKRSSDKACLVRCMPSRREYSDIQNALAEARLNVAGEVKDSYKYGDAKIVINSDLENSFFQKRSEMRELGRHGRELEVNFCFLVLPYNSAVDICQHGLKVNNTPSKLLGDPLMGVYVFRHIDVALTFSKQKNDKPNTVLVLKVLFGKVKKVQPNVSTTKPALDPTPNSDSHMSKKAPTWTDPFEEQVANSLVYLYEYDANFKAVERPRHCLPYALLPVTFQGQKPATGKSLAPFKVNQKLFAPGNDALMNCTVAKRIGKGKNATIIYENIRAPVVKNPRMTEEIPPYLTTPCPPKQGPLPPTEQPLGNLMLPGTFHNILTAAANRVPPQYGTPGIYSAFGKPAADLESLISSSLVITSKTIRDPRLYKRNEPEASKPDDRHLTSSRLTPDCRKSANDSSRCGAGELHGGREDTVPEAKSLYLSFEEKRVLDQQSENKVKGLSLSPEPCDSNKTAKKQCLLKKSSGIPQQTSICAKPTKNNTKVSLADAVERWSVSSPWEGDVSSAMESKREGLVQKQSVDCNIQQKGDVRTHVTRVTPQEIGPKHTQKGKGNSPASPRGDDMKNPSVACNRSTDHLISREEKSPDINRRNSSKAEILRNNATSQRKGADKCSETGDTKKVAHEHEAIKAPSKHGGSDIKKNETGGQRRPGDRRPENSAALDVKAMAECTSTKNVGCPETSERKVLSDEVSTDHAEGFNKVVKQISTGDKQRDCGASRSSVKMSGKPGSSKQRTDKLPDCSGAARNTKPIIKKETECLLYLEERQQQSNFVAPNMHQTDIKMPEIIPVNRRIRCPTKKLAEVSKNGVPTMEGKKDILQATYSSTVAPPKPELPVEETLNMIQKLNHTSRITERNDTDVSNESAISPQGHSSCDAQAKSTLRDNGNVTPPCKADGQNKSTDRKTAAPLQEADAIVVKSTEVERIQEVGMSTEESSCIQCLVARIDWTSLFGIATSEILSDEMKRCGSSKGRTQLYQYKAKTEKEPGGLRIFPDMQVAIPNDCLSFVDGESVQSTDTNTPVQMQTVEGKRSGNKNGPSDDQVTVERVQVTNKVRVRSPKSSTSKENRISNGVHSFNTEETIQPETNNKPVGKDVTSKRRTKFNSKLAHFASEYKQSYNMRVKTRLHNKNVRRAAIKAPVGRIKKFSLSEENIKSVLSMLSDEATSCRSRRISKKLDRAILHLRKAHKRVQRSLQLVERRNKLKAQNGGAVNVRRTNSARSNVNRRITAWGESGAGIKTEVIQTLKDGSFEERQTTPTLIDRECLVVTVQSNNENKVPTFPVPEVSENVEHSNTALAPIKASLKRPKAMEQRQHSEAEDSCEGKLLRDVGLNQTKASPAYKMTKLDTDDITLNNQGHAKQNSHPKSGRNSISLAKELSRLLQKADETRSLKSLKEYKLTCKKLFPTVVGTFEKKQKSSYADVITDQKMLSNQNIRVSFRHVLQPRAIEAFIELQMTMETRQFIENRINYLQGQPTFRSLLWYDSSLYGELISGESGYQQQSPLYRTFQDKVRLYPLDTLQNHYRQLSELLCGIYENSSSYYVFLKYRREIEECEAVLKNCCDLAEFSLSLPLTCGVHIGDTIDDLETLQKSTLELIKTYANSPTCDAGKREHALCLLEVISAKILFIRTSESITLQLSLFGIEHLLFNAAKRLVLRQRSNYGEKNKSPRLTKEFMLAINHYALSKLYEIYGTPNEEIVPARVKDAAGDNSNSDLGVQRQPRCVGEIIDRARCAEPRQLKQMIQDCKEQLNALIKYFQILQECDADEVLITEKNVPEAAKKQEQLAILLKPEAVETYIEVGMMYETLHFLSSLLKKNQERSRGLLFYDTSLFPDLLRTQHRIAPCLPGNLTSNALDVIESTISEIKSELEIICDCAESVNYTYALQIMTRELSELSELKNFVLESEPTIGTYVHVPPFVVSLHYGCTLSELEYNYSQFSNLLGLLMSSPKKDLGRMAHTMQVMKTIELMKNIALKSNKSPLTAIVCQMYNNNCDQGVTGETDKSDKTTREQPPRKRASGPASPNNGDQHSSPKKQKVLKSPPSSSAGEEHQILTRSPSRQRANMEDTELPKTPASENDARNHIARGGSDPDRPSHRNDDMGDDPSSLQPNQHVDSNECNSQALVPSSGSNNPPASYAYPWQYSLYLWYHNGSNTSVVTQSYQGVSHNGRQNLPYGGAPVFSENSYAANQPYFASHSQGFPMPGPFGPGSYYSYTAPPSPFPYDASQSAAWSWDSWQ